MAQIHKSLAIGSFHLQNQYLLLIQIDNVDLRQALGSEKQSRLYSNYTGSLRLGFWLRPRLSLRRFDTIEKK